MIYAAMRSPISSKAFSSSVQTGPLTPLRISTNHVLDALIPDIVAGTKSDLHCIGDQGQNNNVILNICGCAGD